MLLPKTFKSEIAKHFYDKTVEILEVTETNVNGWIEKTTVPVGTFKANVQFDKLGEIQAELGLVNEIHVRMTCSTDELIKEGDLFTYSDVKYRAVKALVRDSHKLVVGELWV